MAQKKEGWGKPFTDPDEAAPEVPAAGGGIAKPAPDVPRGTNEPAAPASAPAKPAVAAEPQPAAAPPAPTAAEIRKWKIKGKVAGAETEFEIGEDYFDEAKNPEKHKWLRDQLQKAADYDRPGGALDQQATKKAQELRTRDMIANGFWQIAPDGKSIIEDPRVKAYREWREAQEKPAPAAPAAGNGHAPAAPSKLTPRQTRIAELEAKYEQDGFTLAEQKEFIKLQTAEERDAEKNAEAAARSAEQQKQAQAAAEQQQEADARAAGEARIKAFVETLADKFKHPISGKINPTHLKSAERVMRDAAVETQDWAQAEAAVREFADGHAAELSELVDKLPKAATAPPPPPVHRGGGISPQAPDDGDEAKDFDSSKTFQRQRGGFTRFVEAEARRGG